MRRLVAPPLFARLPLLLAVAAITLALAGEGCTGERGTSAPPRAEFILGAGDSVFWVRSDGVTVSVRGSPLLLARFGGRFYEVYVADDDRSYFDAVLVSQRVYRRDLVTGDSMLVFQDSTVPAVERAYRNAHPTDERLKPDEEGSDRPHTTATAELEIVDLHGPWLSYEYHADLDIESGIESHTVRRGVLDLRSGREATVAALFGDTAARRLIAAGRRVFEEALDSVLAARDDRARRAADALGELEFDSTSFSVTDSAREPAVEFVAIGHGSRAGGIALPLQPIAARRTAWWEAIVDGLPLVTQDTAAMVWRRTAYTVLARIDSAGDLMTLSLGDSSGRTWVAGRLPAGAAQIYWLDHPPLDSAARHGLARAFDEAVFYSDDARSASLVRPRVQPRVTLTSWQRSGSRSDSDSARGRRRPASASSFVPRPPPRPPHRPSHRSR